MAAASISTPSTMPPTVAGASINPQLLQLVQRMPADQQAQAMQELQGMNPAQQQQLLAQVTQAQAQAAPQAGSAQAAAQTGASQATLGASATAPNPPSLIKTLLKNVAVFGGVGAALGFGASFFTLPVIGQVGAPIAAAVGGGIGAVVGLVKGFFSHRKQAAEYTAQAEAAAQQQAAAAQAAPPVAEPAASESLAPVKKPSPAKQTSMSSGGDSYTVKKGDTLSAIAKRHDMSWKELYAANRQAVGANPNMIHPGLKLVIP